MDIGRRNFVKGLVGVGALVLIGGIGAVKHFISRKVLRGVQPKRYCGGMKRLSYKDIGQMGTWKG
jgi:hypothetical protein